MQSVTGQLWVQQKLLCWKRREPVLMEAHSPHPTCPPPPPASGVCSSDSVLSVCFFGIFQSFVLCYNGLPLFDDHTQAVNLLLGFLAFHFEIVNHRELQRHVQGGPCTLPQPPPVFTSCTIVVQYPNQEVGIGAMYKNNSIPAVLHVLTMCVFACLCVALCSFITCVASGATITSLSNCTKTTRLPHPAPSQPHACPFPIPNPWQALVCHL